jgi:hypothetical protein
VDNFMAGPPLVVGPDPTKPAIQAMQEEKLDGRVKPGHEGKENLLP